MTAEELAKLQMQLQYEKGKRLWEKGKISKAELEALKPETVVEQLQQKVVAEPPVLSINKEGKKDAKAVNMVQYEPAGMAFVQLNAEAIEAVAMLKAEMHEIDKKKGALSNSLGSYPKNVPVPQITEQILRLRDEWANRSKMVKLIEMNGLSTGTPAALLEVTSKAEPLSNEAMQQAIIDSLPTDKYELKSKELNLVSVLAKDRGKLRAAKDPGKKQELTVKIQQNEILLEAMRERLKR